MEPSAAIAIIETDLRRLVGVVLHKALGPEWLDELLDEETRSKLDDRRIEESKRRAPAVVPSDLLAYTHLYELRRFIERRWELFKPALGEKKEFTVLMDKVEDFRNAPAHSRELLSHERALLEGIAGTVRTQVTRFVSLQAPDGQHYPVIESVRDPFGNEFVAGAPQPDFGLTLASRARLQVGQTVQFVARGWDPQGRELTWRWAAGFPSRGPSTVGNEVIITWAPTDDDVADVVFLEIEMLSAGKYHRNGSYDQRVQWPCAVEPPLE